MAEACVLCGRSSKRTRRQWWHLKGYYGLTGFVCHRCFAKVAHENGAPKHPLAYRNALKKLASTDYQPKTALGRKLMEVRSSYLASGGKLLSAEELDEEMRTRI